MRSLYSVNDLCAQEYLFKADSCNAVEFPVVKGHIYHRGYGESVLKKEQLDIREDGRHVDFTLVPSSASRRLPRNKRVFLLIENHYQPKGIPQRNFFANVISAGIYNTVSPGDQFMIATFDWQRKGQYIFPAFKNYTDDTAVLRSALRLLTPPPALYNRQEGADINNSLDESLKFLSPTSDSIPTAIILFSDDLDNSVGRIMNLDIQNKALQSKIPIYAVSYAMYSRYNPVMRDEICKPTYGKYFISPENDIKAAGQKLKEFLNELIADYQGTTFSFSFNSLQPKNEQKLSLEFIVRNTSLKDIETVMVPSLTLKEKIARNPKQFIFIAGALLLAFALILIFIIRTRRKHREQEGMINKTRNELIDQSQKIEKEKAATEARINAIQQQHADNEKERLTEEHRANEEKRLIQLMLGRGVFPSLHYSFKDTSGKIDVSLPVFTIGRDTTNNFYIQLDTVSRKHATIVFDDSGKYTIIDNNSSNGTLVNGEKIKQAVLRSDDIIQIGGINLIFHN